MRVLLKKDVFVKAPNTSALLQLVHVLRGDSARLFWCDACKNKRTPMSTEAGDKNGAARPLQKTFRTPPFQIFTNLFNSTTLVKLGQTVTYWRRRRRWAPSSPPHSHDSAAWTCSPGQLSYQRTWGQAEAPSSFDPTVTSKRWRRQEVLSHSLVLAGHSQTFHSIGDAIRRSLWVGEHLVCFTITASEPFKRRTIRLIMSWSQTNHAMKIMMKIKRTGGKKANLNLFLLDGHLT